MTRLRQISFMMVSSLMGFTGLYESHAATPAFGTPPPEGYGLGSNIGVYISEDAILSTCVAVYSGARVSNADASDASEVAYYAARLAISENSKIIARLIDVAPIALAGRPVTVDGRSSCSGSVDLSTGLYDDVVMVQGTPFNLTFRLTDPVNIVFELIDSSVVSKTADMAFILRGYGNSTSFRTVNSFKRDAQAISDQLRALSFGAVGSYRIFDGGIDRNSADNYAAIEQIKVIDAALSGWVGSPWASFKERDEALGVILTNPSERERVVLGSLRAWLQDNKQSAEVWGRTDPGATDYAWVQSKVLRYGASAAPSFLHATQLPRDLDRKKFTALGLIFSSGDTYNMSGAANLCSSFGIKTAEGEPFPIITSWQGLDPRQACFYNDYSNPLPGTQSEASLFATNTYVSTHEMLHALGQGGHDRYDDRRYFPYSIMNQGKVDQYPIWNRIYIMGWLGEDAITQNPAELADTYQATDRSKKYLLRLGPESDFSCLDEWGVTQTCHRYQEKYNGTYVQYRADYTKDGKAYFKSGVTFEPLNDPSDKRAPTLIPVSDSIAARLNLKEGRLSIVLTFSEEIQLGRGEITLRDVASGLLMRFQLDQLPDLSDSRVSVNNNTLELSPWNRETCVAESCAAVIAQRLSTRYTLTLSQGSVIDRAGNAVVAAELNIGP